MSDQVKAICRDCKSEDLEFDATVKWDKEQQKYVFNGAVYDDPYCVNCDMTTKADWVN